MFYVNMHSHIMCNAQAESEIVVGYWPFSDQFQDLAEQK